MAAVSSGYSPLDHHGGEALQKADVGVPELSEGETSSSALQPKRSSEKTLRYAAVALCALFSFVAVLFLTRQHNSATEDAGLRSARHGPRLADTGEEIGLAANAAKIKSFYMYRVQNDEDYSPENQNMANVGGALWYLHNEIVWHHFLRAGTFASTPKTRIERYLVFTRATPQLYAKGMNFGVVNTYDLGQCTGPFKCENLQEYGPVVGCESWKKRPDGKMGNNFPHGQWVGQNFYPNAMWYSLPGRCSSLKFWNQTGNCEKKEPSGACPANTVPTGEKDCTYTYQKVGEISINEIENISSFDALIKGEGREYDKIADKGVHLHFWDHIKDEKACQKRIDRVLKLFEDKYPKQPVLKDPECDFEVEKFYPYFPQGYFHTSTSTTPGPVGKTAAATASTLRLSDERRGSFLVIGDWGYDAGEHGSVSSKCQRAVAEKMLHEIDKLGDVKFVINVGGSFFPKGVTSKEDQQWQSKWRDVYDKKLRNVPWYSVYGNRDYRSDPCACTADPTKCAQINYDIRDLEHFYMPGYSWYKDHPELDLEVLALDLGGETRSKSFDDCNFTSCPGACRENMQKRSKEALELFHKRSAASIAKNLLVFSHYPTEYFGAGSDILEGLGSDRKHKILYFGGHRHVTEEESSEVVTSWTVGGGGGWSCDGKHQGFVVGEIQHDYSVKTRAALVDYDTCCGG
eukprot:TRINITY_DN94686_c0_g1_i1.p1 TRINITY_DN94686_c0_g1~~TRINITY_DN94686_c0_g1_i1.p1  ORF type:complete len:687 (-),score=137.69 TRINITY_DN94686_c0_g1_i1:78-2138(-)